MNKTTTRAAYFALALLTLVMSLSFAACTPGAGGGTATAVPTEAAASATEPQATEEPREPLTYKEVFNPETDFDNRFDRGLDSVVETDEAYYYLTFAGTYIYYFDKASGERGVLCGKPECVHDAEESNSRCNGYADVVGALGCWRGRLHFIATTPGGKENYSIMSMELDGSDKRTEAYTSLMIGDTYYTPQISSYHRGKLYCWDDHEIVHDGEPANETCIFTIDPETGKLTKVYSVESDFVYNSPSLFFFGNYVYFYLGHIEETENGDWVTCLELRRYDIETEEIEDIFICSREGFLGSRMNIWVESEDVIYLMPTGALEIDGDTNKLYKLEAGELTVAADFSFGGWGGILDGAAIVGSPSTRRLEVRRFNGDIIYSGAWELDHIGELVYGEESDYYIGSIFGDEEELLIGLLVSRKTGELPEAVCLIKHDLTEETPQATLIACYPWK